MKTIVKSLLATLMAGALMAPLPQAVAQSNPEPAIVVSMSNLDSQMGTVNYLVKSAGFGDMGFLIKLQADQYLKGVDRAKPFGALLYFNEDSPEPDALGFVPVSNLEDVLDTLSQNVGEIEEGDDFNVLITNSEEEILIKEVNGYAFIADSEELFERIPKDPAAELGDLPQQYNMAFKVFGQRVPESLRNQATDLIRDGYEAQLNQMGEDDLQSALQKKNFDMQMEQISSFVNETDYLLLGMKADSENGNLFMEMEFVGLEGSKLAKQCAVASEAQKTAFAGFLMEGSAFDFNSCSKVLPEDTEQFSSMMGQAKEEILNAIDEDGDLSDDEIQTLESVIEKLVGALEDTVKSGVMDGGGVLKLNDGLNLAIGAKIASPKKVEDAAKEAVAFIRKKDTSGLFTANLDSANYNGINMHEIIVSIDDAEEEVREMFGTDEVKIYLGIGKDAVYLAAGSNPMDLLKQGIDGSANGPSGEMPLSQYNFYLAPIFKFAASIEGEQMMEMLGEKLSEKGKDRIRVVGETIEKGMKIRFEMQDGILELFSLGMGMQGQMGDDF